MGGNRETAPWDSFFLGVVPSCRGFVPILRGLFLFLEVLFLIIGGLSLHAQMLYLISFFLFQNFVNILVPKILVPPLPKSWIRPWVHILTGSSVSFHICTSYSEKPSNISAMSIQYAPDGQIWWFMEKGTLHSPEQGRKYKKWKGKISFHPVNINFAQVCNEKKNYYHKHGIESRTFWMPALHCMQTEVDRRNVWRLLMLTLNGTNH